MKIGFPLKGKFLGSPTDRQPEQTSRDLNNVRPLFNGRFVGGQRDGKDKVMSQQISNAPAPIVDMVSVTIVDTGV